MSSIIDMPDLVLEHIIGFLDFRAVYTLRQVCKDFRNFINEMKKSKLPDSKFKKFHVFLKNEEMIRLTFIWSFGSQIEIERYFEKEKPGFIDLFYINSPNFELSHLTVKRLEDPEKEQANAELTADGMTQPSIDGLAALTQRFATGFPLETTDAHNFIKSMPENDQSIYNTYLKKYGLA